MADQTTINSPFGWRPDSTAFAPVDAVPQALILRAATVLADVEGDQPSLHVPFVIDDLDVPFIAEDSELDATDPQLAEVLVHTAKASMLTRISYEQWIKVQTAGQLATSFARSLAWASDKAFLSQVAPTSPAVAPPAGLQNISGLVDGGEIVDDLDPLADLIGLLQFNNSHPNLIVVDPVGWSELRKLKLATDWNATLLGRWYRRRAAASTRPARGDHTVRAAAFWFRHRQHCHRGGRRPRPCRNQ